MVAGSYGPTVARPHLLKPRKGASEATAMADTCRMHRRFAGLALALTFLAGPLLGVPKLAAAQTVRDVFQKVRPRWSSSAPRAGT